jgi:signal transduction histidine kinase
LKAFHDLGRDALLLETLSIIAKCQDSESFWAQVVGRLKWILDFTRVDVALRNPDGSTYNLQTVFELRPHAPAILRTNVPLSGGIFGKMISSGEACHCFNPRSQPFDHACIVDAELEGGSLLSIMSVSLEANQTLGVISFGTPEEAAYCHQDMEIASRFATHAAIAIQTWQQLAKLKEDALLLDLAAEKLTNSHANLETLVDQRTRSLRGLSQQLLKTQDEERRRVARELHDSVGQTLSALKMSITKVQKVFPGDLTTSDAFAEIAVLADQAIEEIRTTSYLLHPPLLDELGLKSAAHWYVDGFSKRSGIQVNLNFPSTFERLPNDVEMVLFRVLQESLTNVHRHASASLVNIMLERGERVAHLEVQDDGHGIPAEVLAGLRNAVGHSGVGVTGMRERITELNGKFELDSDSNGTALRVTIPIDDI